MIFFLKVVIALLFYFILFWCEEVHIPVAFSHNLHNPYREWCGASQTIVILVLIWSSSLVDLRDLAQRFLGTHTSIEFWQTLRWRSNAKPWTKLTTTSTTKQACVNIMRVVSHVGIENATLLTGCTSFVRASLLEACHQEEDVLHFKALASLTPNLLQLLGGIPIVNARNVKVCSIGLKSVPIHPHLHMIDQNSMSGVIRDM